MSSKTLKALRVLLVEDEKKLASLLKNAIGDSFYSFTLAKDGKDGLEKFLSISPDIIITDIMMPRLTGLEMAREIRKVDEDIPIIILSAFSESDKFLDAIDIGVVKYFIKPFDPEELLEYIQSVAEKLGIRVIELCDDFSYRLTTKSLYKNSKFISLSKNENIFMQLLLQDLDENIIVDDETIKKKIWADENVSDDRLRTFIRRLRAKTSKELIKNIKGQGYRLVMKK